MLNLFKKLFAIILLTLPSKEILPSLSKFLLKFFFIHLSIKQFPGPISVEKILPLFK